ncbi:MAG TPA: hypothetical protein VII63_10230 [Caulobacteraceae bacterium]
MAPALILALFLLASSPAPAAAGEPLPPGAPTGDYELAAWCFGAMSEYLDVYDQVKPDLRDIDRVFGSSVKNEAEPYSADMRAARVELKVLAGAVEAAEKASAQPIADRGVAAIRLGRAIWSPAEQKTHRELARAWLSWALPDACDARARKLAAEAKLLGNALTYNNPDGGAAPSPPPPAAPPPPAKDAAPAPTSPPPS